MKPHNFFDRSVTNRRGSAFVQALVAVGVVGLMIYFLSPTVIKHRAQVTKTASIITARLALHSMIDYTLYGIKQRWCFSDAWLGENCSSSLTGGAEEILSHPRSTERLLMKTDTIPYLQAIGIKNPAGVLLDRFEQKITLGSFTSMHPVYKIVADLKGYKVSAFNVVLERDRLGLIPEYGREVYLKVKVQLLDETGAVIQVGGSKLEATSYVGVYPREVGSFALLVAGDLRLDRQSSAGLGIGTAYFNQFSSRSERMTYPGISFESPVFVNGAIHLPAAPDAKEDELKNDTIYTPVTFKEKLVLGEGPVMRAGAEFKPRSAGASVDELWSNVRQFGGFQRGVEVDGNRDLGLDYLSGQSAGTGAPVSLTLMDQCIKRANAKMNLNVTKDSKLSGQLLAQGSGKYNYRLYMNDGNVFSNQSGEVRNPYTNGWSNFIKNYSTSGTSRASKYELKIGDNTIMGEIANDGSVTIQPNIDLAAYRRMIEGRLRDASNAADNAQSSLNSAKANLRNANDRAADLQSDLNREQSKVPMNSIKVGDIQRDLSNARQNANRWQNEVNERTNELATAEAKKATVTEQFNTARNNENLKPTITLSMNRPLKDGEKDDSNSNPSFKDLDISFQHGSLFINPNTGDLLNMSVTITAYDIGYWRGNNLRWSNNGNNEGFIRISRNGKFEASSLMTGPNGEARAGLPTDADPYLNMDSACEQAMKQMAFKNADWSISFASSSRISWGFVTKWDSQSDIDFTGSNSFVSSGGIAAGSLKFHVESISRNCIIKSSANFVTGFLNCEKLIIEARSTPLRIIGSIIVRNGIEIDPSAYNAGIRWSSVYDPMATFELRRAGILKATGSNTDCTTINRFPVWHPFPSITDVANLYRCNAISLRAKADPYRWTSVDPDCGLISGQSSTQCKNRLVKAYVLEISRESGI